MNVKQIYTLNNKILLVSTELDILPGSTCKEDNSFHFLIVKEEVK